MNTKEQAYKRGQFGGKIGFGKSPAIVVVDFQKGFTLPDAMAGGDMTREVEATAKITTAAHKKNIRAFYTRVGYNKDGSDLGVFGLKVGILKEFSRDSVLYELDDRLQIADNGIVLEKHWPSAFFGTHLNQMLIPMSIDTIIVTGCTTAGCVYATVIDSCSYGYRTIVVSDAVADRSSETHNIFLWNMGQKYADIMTSDEVIQEIGKLQSLPEYRFV